MIGVYDLKLKTEDFMGTLFFSFLFLPVNPVMGEGFGSVRNTGQYKWDGHCESESKLSRK